MKNDINVKTVDDLLRKFFPSSCDKVAQAMEYSVFSGGKRIRPMLLLATAQAVGGNINDGAKTLAAALEYIHTYSLIHDDLPCMDNDDLRRGKRSCHMQYGEACAVLAGDALLNLAVEVCFGGPIGDKRYSEACKYLFAMRGVNGMIHGQSLDLFTETKNVDDANEVALHKTGDLLRAAIVCGALCGGAREEEIAIFDRIAIKLGVCYQVIDDMLDSSKCEKSFLDVMGERDLKEYAQNLTHDIAELIKRLPYDMSFISEIAAGNLTRTK